MGIITIRALLCLSEEARQYLWQLFIGYTLIINQLLEDLPKQPEFEKWRDRGLIPRQKIKALCKKLKDKEPFQDLPARFYTSAELSTQYTFASIFAIQRKLYLKREGKQAWLTIQEHDLELAHITVFSQEEIRNMAVEILAKAAAQREQELNPKSQKSQSLNSLMGILFKFWNATQRPLEQRAIAHLLRNDCQVHPEEDPENLPLRLERKRIQIQRIQKQMEIQLPIGRDPLGDRTQTFINEAIAFPEGEFEAWEQDLPRRMENLSSNLQSLPYPVLFGSADDLYWSWEATPHSSSHTPSEVQVPEPTDAVRRKPKRSRTRKRQKQDIPRICIRFKSKELSNLRAKVYCDRRQLPIFRQCLTDYKENKARKKQDEFSLALFPLRTAHLVWERGKQLPGKHNDEEPWQTHRLYLHCTIDPRLLTAEGTEEVRQERIKSTEKFLDSLNEKSNQTTEEQLLELTSEEQTELLRKQKNRQKIIKKNQTTLKRLRDNSPPPRPSRVAYQGNPDVAMQVAFSRQHIVGAAVVNVRSQQVLEYCDVRSLLSDQRLALLGKRSIKLRTQPQRQHKTQSPAAVSQEPKSKAGHLKHKPRLSTKQLQLQQYRLIGRWRNLKQQNLSERQVEQQQGLYRTSPAESNLSQYLNRLLAKRIVECCQRWQASTIVLPEFGELRESIESEILAKAKQKYPDDNVKLQKQYAKEFRMSFHQWSYKALSQCIHSCAAEVGITVVPGRQPREGTLREKAIAVTPRSLIKCSSSSA